MEDIEFTYQMRRYLDEIVKIYDDFNLLVDFDDDKTITIKNYSECDEINPRIDLENQEFWSYLEKIRAIKIEKSAKPKWIVYSSDELDEKFIAPAETFFKILDIEKVKGLRKKLETLIKNYTSKEILYFDEARSILYINRKEVKIRKFSEQYHVLRVMFKDPQRLKDEQFFSELGNLIDEVKKYTNKQFHNYFSAIKRRVSAETGIKDLFLTTNQSVRINPNYLKSE